MLNKLIPGSLAAALLGIGLAVSAPAAATAGNVDLRIETGHGTLHIGNGWHRDRRDYRERRGYDRYGRMCHPRRAIHKAHRMGVRYPHIDRIGRRLVIVEGRKRGGHVRIAFAKRSPYCDVAWVDRDRRGRGHGRHGRRW